MRKLPRLIALVGQKGSGKTTLAKELELRGHVRLNFADPLKQMLASLGLTPDELYGDKKEVKSDLLCGMTPRHAMQTLGTEWGRQLIHDYLWINVWQSRASALLLEGHSLVVDDCRFRNEAEAIQSMQNGTLGGHDETAPGSIMPEVWRIARGQTASKDMHPSEREQLSIPVRRWITNDGSIADFIKEALDD